MLAHQIASYAFNLSVAQRTLANLPDELFTLVPFPGHKPPVWVLGHLAIAGDFAAEILSLPRVCPEPWHAHFGPGKPAPTWPDPRPTKSELLEAHAAQHARVAEHAAKVSPALLAAPNPVPFFEGTSLRTLGDLLSHLMTSHEGLHLGQLSCFRAARGLPPLF